MKIFQGILVLIVPVFSVFAQNTSYFINQDSPELITNQFFANTLQPGDTIFIENNRTKKLIFEQIEGNESHPVIVMNKNGIVNIADNQAWAAIEFRNCKYFKLTGKGFEPEKFGFKLSANSTGIGITEFSSNAELENIFIKHGGFSGIMAKKDFHGNPPNPTPVFSSLVIHDCFIQDVSEGMYLGETISPGMEFKHVKIFNNVTYNTKREGIQLANMVEDVEVYNNLVVNSGREYLETHGNGIQIGDNTIGDFYKNVILNSTEFGIIVFGSGDINIFDNYLANNKGVFIDNRKITLPYSSIVLENNFFREIKAEQAIDIYNFVNAIYIKNNTWFGAENFIKYNHSNENLLFKENNQYNYFEPIQIKDFSVSESNPIKYKELGPQLNNTFQFNFSPQIEMEKSFVLNWETTDTIHIKATTSDGDLISFSLKDNMDFSFLKDNGNGTAQVLLNPKKSDQGIYKAFILASDHSHNHKSRKQFTIAVKNPENHAPGISKPGLIAFTNLQNNEFNFNLTDSDNDSLFITFENYPSFVKLAQNGLPVHSENSISSALPLTLSGKPGFSELGLYESIKIKVDDGYGACDSAIFNLQILQKILTENLVLYRVNCGGPTVEDQNLDWEDSYNQKLKYQVSQMYNTGAHSWSGINYTGVPNNVFGPFSYSINHEQNMKWLFECPNGQYEVKLCFIERQTDLDNNKLAVFNGYVNNKKLLSNFSIFNENGLLPVTKSFVVDVSNQKIDIQLEQIENNPKISGIEIKLLKLQEPTIVVDYQNDLDFLIFPNPANKQIFVRTLQSEKIVCAEIFGINGKSLKTTLSNKGNIYHILFEKKSGGVHFLRCTFSDGTVKTRKIMIN